MRLSIFVKQVKENFEKLKNQAFCFKMFKELFLQTFLLAVRSSFSLLSYSIFVILLDHS